MWFKLFAVMGAVGQWTRESLAPKIDANGTVIESAGVVTVEEMTQLGVTICKIFGIKTELDVGEALVEGATEGEVPTYGSG